ncbi:hypothetical protein Forpi1262_v002102 [Fusarium oxysporum f. sp. raphani]|uniref:Uncharacterized protein n=1 Tax=Fusarium oxysporum f. sp. raphani TaxID=96318 RepID=A0A8J5UAT4_FUSOX|nr:hypothetical protein Forpi1262_v002102 [Fusarium oxysporum f. sp. raphani]
MATTRRQSNAEREKWRTKCCEALCSHINSRLSLSLEPSQVRLLPVREDPYRWSIVPGKEYLFEKNLSDQSTKIYKDLYQGINKDFKATKPPPSLLDKLPQRDNASTPHQTTIRVTSQINELQVQKDYALQRIKLLESQLQEELKRRTMDLFDSSMKTCSGIELVLVDDEKRLTPDRPGSGFDIAS